MISSPQKIQAIARDLGSRLALRIAGHAGLNTVRYASDANGGPELFLSHNGNEAAGQPVALVHLQQISMVSSDIFGNSLLAYTPSLSQIAYEVDATGKPIPTEADLDTIKFELFPFGMRYQLIEIANGTAVTVANADAATPSLDVEPNLYWPTKGV